MLSDVKVPGAGNGSLPIPYGCIFAMNETTERVKRQYGRDTVVDPTIRPNRLKELRIAKGWTHVQAADAIGVSKGAFVKWERRERELKDKPLELCAKAFGVHVSQIFADQQTVSIVAEIAADIVPVLFYPADIDSLGVAPMPPGGSEKTVAAVVGKVAIGLIKENWLVYFDDEMAPVDEVLIGELCVVEMEDGRQLVRTPFYGRVEGTFDLEAEGWPTLRGERLKGASRVTSIVPRKPEKVSAGA